MDVTLIRLLDGTRLYLHAVSDNYSRKLLAWELANKLDLAATCRMLEIAGRHLVGLVPTVMAASGVENVNNQIDKPLDTGKLRRVLAQVEVSCSNSMSEVCWCCLKHSWLYLHSLDSAAAVERLVVLYVEQHSTVMPHRAFDGRTPDEVYFGVAVNLASELAERRRLAREERMASNRSMTCAARGPRDTVTEAVPREAV